jgi:hypothetical protein
MELIGRFNAERFMMNKLSREQGRSLLAACLLAEKKRSTRLPYKRIVVQVAAAIRDPPSAFALIDPGG